MNGLAIRVGRTSIMDYVRRPLNLVMLLAVPPLIVVVWGAPLADFSKVILGGSGDRSQIEAATAGWAAAMLAGITGFFQVTGSLASDRRLAAAGGRSASVVAGRVGAASCIAMVASVGGLVALQVRTGITEPFRAVAATVVVAVIYLALGMLVGTVVRSEMNGALLVTLLWVFDVFLGPALGPGSSFAARLLPLHFPTLVLIGQASGHAGPLGDVGWSIMWAIGLLTVAAVRLARATRPVHQHTRRAIRSAPSSTPVHQPVSSTSVSSTPVVGLPKPPAAQTWQPHSPTPSSSKRFAAVLASGGREFGRNQVLWALLAAVPAVFIVMAVMITVDKPGPVALIEGTQHYTAYLSERRIHAATMVPIAASFLAGLTGLFVVTESAAGDRRLVIAGFRAREVLAGRVGVISAATVLTTGVAIAVSGAFYGPRQWIIFSVANLLIALTYAMIGVLVGPITGRLGGLYLVLILAFMDVGLGQSVMFPKGPPAWGTYLPARGASRVMIDGAFTSSFDEQRFLLLGLGWLVVLGTAATTMYRRRMKP